MDSAPQQSPSADAYTLTIGVPGDDRTLTMVGPEWAELPEGWQLGGFVDYAALNEFGPLFGTDRIIATHPDGMPEFISLRTGISHPTSYGYQRVFVKIPTARGPRRPLTAEPKEGPR